MTEGVVWVKGKIGVCKRGLHKSKIYLCECSPYGGNLVVEKTGGRKELYVEENDIFSKYFLRMPVNQKLLKIDQIDFHSIG